jgi:hypothetical protein
MHEINETAGDGFSPIANTPPRGIYPGRASVITGMLSQASRADDGLRQAWRRRTWKAVAMTLSVFLTRE